MMKHKIYYIFFLSLSILLALIMTKNWRDKGIFFQENFTFISMDQFNPQEKIYLKKFFKTLFFSSSFGYTIFGEKPMSIEVITLDPYLPKIEDLEYADIEYFTNFYNLHRGWRIWKNHFEKIPLKGFSLISYPSTIGSKHLEISIINHQKFLEVVSEHLDVFQIIINKKLEPNEILGKYIKGEGEIFQIIQNHHGLLGILLGYGKDNAWQFLNDAPLGDFVDLKSLNFENMDEILLPSFKVIENTSETKLLRESYFQQREKINKIYQSDLFLETVLEKLHNIKMKK